MLKKLVKYGNSNALVLDRTILALLNIDEGSTVKLRIEGDSLIIKAAEEVKPTESLRLEIENAFDKIPDQTASTEALKEFSDEKCRAYGQQLDTSETLKEWLPGTENSKKLEEAYRKIMAKYQDQMELLSSSEFQNEMDELAQKFEGNHTSNEFIEEVQKLRFKHAPGLMKMDEEMHAVTEQLGFPKELNTPQ